MKDKSLRVLIIEASEDDTLLLLRTLRKGGYDPLYERVETAAAMKKALKEKQWNIILCDYSLPKFDAPSAIAVLKKANVDIPLIVVTGTIGKETISEFMRLDVQGYIMKSNLSQLCPAIERELEEAEIRVQRKLADEALKESESKYRLLADNIHDVIFIMDMNLNYTYISPSVKILRGYEPEEASKQAPADALTPSSLDLAMRNLSEIMEIEKSEHREINISRTLELEMRRKDGTTVWTEVKFSLFRDKKKRLVGIIGVTRDITERKRVEEKLRKSEANYRQLFDNSPAAIYQIDFKSGRFLKANDLICEYIGCSQEEITSLSPYDLLTEKSKKLFLERLEKISQGLKVPETVEYEVFDKKGKQWCLQLHTKNIYDAEGHVVAADVVAHDITELKKAEKALKKSEAKYRSIFENAIEGIYQSTIEGRFITANAALARMIGYDSPEELIKSIKDIGTQLYVHYEDRKRFMEIIKAKGFVDGFEVEFFKKNGSKFWVVVNARTVKDEQGGILYIEGLIEDITIRKHSEEQLHQTIENLKKKVPAIQEN